MQFGVWLTYFDLWVRFLAPLCAELNSRSVYELNFKYFVTKERMMNRLVKCMNRVCSGPMLRDLDLPWA